MPALVLALCALVPAAAMRRRTFSGGLFCDVCLDATASESRRTGRRPMVVRADLGEMCVRRTFTMRGGEVPQNEEAATDTGEEDDGEGSAGAIDGDEDDRANDASLAPRRHPRLVGAFGAICRRAAGPVGVGAGTILAAFAALTTRALAARHRSSWAGWGQS